MKAALSASFAVMRAGHAVLETEVFKARFQPRHLDHLISADVDPAEQRDISHSEKEDSFSCPFRVFRVFRGSALSLVAKLHRASMEEEPRNTRITRRRHETKPKHERRLTQHLFRVRKPSS